MLFLIGTGLCDALDLSTRAREYIEQAGHVYLEGYTSLLRCTPKEFADTIGKPITVLSREDVEKNIDPVLAQAKTSDVAFLVVGDPFGATTHADLFLRAHAAQVPVTVVHNASILNAVGATGLELYRFGKTVSLPYWEKGLEPTSFLDGIAKNHAQGLHTLCLLDIKADQKQFMTINEGIKLLMAAQAVAGPIGLTKDTLIVGVARLGWPEQIIVAGTAQQLSMHDFGKPPHALIIPGTLHPIEEEMLALWKES